MKKLILIFLVILLCIKCNNDSTVIFIDGDNIPDIEEPTPNDGLAISPILVGTNAWFTNPSRQVWDLTAASGVTSIRIGGNAFNNNMPSNTELLNWVKEIQAMGAEPIMQVSQVASAASAAALVKYFNVDLASGKPIKYWNIGNEPWLFFNRPATSTLGDRIEPYFKERAAAMKLIDPTIKIYGPDFAYYIEDALDDLFGGKNNIAGKVPGKDYYYCDGIAWHRYPQEDNIDLAYAGLNDFRTSIIKCKAKIDAVNIQLSRTGNDALGWGIGEYNAKGGPQVHTWKNGQMFGGILGLCMEYGATYATSWSMFENGGNRQGTDFSFIDGANMTPRATYRHMEMITKNFRGNFAKGKSTKSDVIVFGSVNGNKISVMIINRANAATPFNLNLNYDTVNTTAGIGLNLNAESNLSLSGNLEALSTHTYVFENGKIIRTAYTNANFLSQQPPTITEL
jgi:hypothetical protein